MFSWEYDLSLEVHPDALQMALDKVDEAVLMISDRWPPSDYSDDMHRGLAEIQATLEEWYYEALARKEALYG